MYLAFEYEDHHGAQFSIFLTGKYSVCHDVESIASQFG